ncbi:NAD(P)H-binding protein [Hoeflea sp. Naph1]|uniref:NAD(P)H-binding protein n=1 Tax=Hoeflea sp. Naph1 TaxID=3388653 RepID=UPI00398FFEF4
MADGKQVVMIGATGAVGGEVVKALLGMDSVGGITLIGRKRYEGSSSAKVSQHVVDVADPESYRHLLPGHSHAICTLGVGQPSKEGRAQFLRIDRDLPLAFGRACREAGVGHFQLLSSVGADATSKSFYLRSKGELERGLLALGFARLSLFHPSMILTPTNRYGASQALTLAVWPWLTPLLAGPLRKFRGVKLARLGQAIALNLERTALARTGEASEILEWDDFNRICEGETRK